MKKHLSIFLLIIFGLCATNSWAQLSDKEKLTEALYLMDEKREAKALPLLEELYAKDKDNSNINYNIGICYLHSFDEKKKKEALPYLIVASKNVSPKYTFVSAKEKRAPVDTYYQLAKALHADYQFDEAIVNFKKFKEYINEKHYLWNTLERDIEMSEYAKYALANPVNIEINNLGDSVNSFYPDYSPIIRIDESAVYFTSRRLREDSSNYEIFDPADGMLYEDLYVSYKEYNSETWSKPYLLNINTEDHEATVNLSVDGQTLYIYKDIGGNGDLFASKLESDSAGFEKWSEPTLLGSDINLSLIHI